MAIKITYLACDFEERFPIITADSFENIRKALDDYCGADERNLAKFIAFYPYNCKYPNDYEGYFEYKCSDNKDWNNTYIVKFKIYCLEFFPETRY